MTMARRWLCAVLCVMTMLTATSAQAAKVTATPSPYAEATLAPDAPTYDAEKPEELSPDNLYAWSAVLMEADSGNVIFEKGADDIRYPASTTKIMTVLLALMALEERELDETVVVSETAAAVNNTEDDISSMDLQPGEKINMLDLLYGTMLLSANDGANVIAERVSGSIEAFVDEMNRVAQYFGCENTHFANPHGLHDPYHYTTPRDMAIIARQAMMNDTFRDIVHTRSKTIAATNVHRARTCTNTNELFNPGTQESANKYYFPDAIGIKTGFTSPAQYCFVGAAERDGVELISVVMYTGKRARWADTIKLMNYGFSQYVSVTPIDLYNMKPITIETSGYATDDPGLGKLTLHCVPEDTQAAARATIIATQEDVTAMANNLRSTVMIQYTRDFTAPITAGEIIGTLTYFLQSGEAVVYDLIATRSIAKRANAPKTLQEIMDETAADPNPFPPLTFELAFYALLPLGALILLFRILRLMRKRRRRNAKKAPPVSRMYLK